MLRVPTPLIKPLGHRYSLSFPLFCLFPFLFLDQTSTLLLPARNDRYNIQRFYGRFFPPGLLEVSPEPGIIKVQLRSIASFSRL